MHASPTMHHYVVLHVNQPGQSLTASSRRCKVCQAFQATDPVLTFQVPKLSCVHTNDKGSQQTMTAKPMYTWP